MEVVVVVVSVSLSRKLLAGESGGVLWGICLSFLLCLKVFFALFFALFILFYLFCQEHYSLKLNGDNIYNFFIVWTAERGSWHESHARTNYEVKGQFTLKPSLRRLFFVPNSLIFFYFFFRKPGADSFSKFRVWNDWIYENAPSRGKVWDLERYLSFDLN